jgi:hypothetical protein
LSIQALPRHRFQGKYYIYRVYETVSKKLGGLEQTLSLKQNVQNWIKSSLGDPIVKILAQNSSLTRIQLETLVIDVLAENLASKQLKYEEKARIRQTKAGISRGSFNRTLRQAKTNIIKSIYTVLLLGYLGILEDSSITPYIEAANKLKSYAEVYRDVLRTPEGAREQFQVITMLRDELENTLNQLSKAWTSRS